MKIEIRWISEKRNIYYAEVKSNNTTVIETNIFLQILLVSVWSSSFPHCNHRVKTLDLAKGKYTKDCIIKSYTAPSLCPRVTEYLYLQHFKKEITARHKNNSIQGFHPPFFHHRKRFKWQMFSHDLILGPKLQNIFIVWNCRMFPEKYFFLKKL